MLPIRRATIDDVDHLVQLRILFFEETRDSSKKIHLLSLKQFPLSL